MISQFKNDKLFIVFVTMSLWDEPHRGRHHYATLLSEKHRVLWINKSLDIKEDNPLRRGLEKVSDNLTVLHTGGNIVPGRIEHRLNLNNLIRFHLLQRELKVLGKPDIIWIYDYKAIKFAKYYRNKAKTIYFCNDYFGEYAFRHYETKIAKNVNYVFATSPRLVDRLGVIKSNATLLPHGCWPSDKVPKYLKKKTPQTVGYVGTLRNVIDTKFLRKIVTHTDLKLILAGPIIECSYEKRLEFLRLFKHKRVNYLGNLDLTEIQEVISDLDICLLPYVRSIKTQYNFVIKYFEYLAMGKPIVATSYFQWPKPYHRFVSIYYEQKGIEQFFNDVYSQWNENYYYTALELAQKCTWQKRLQQLGRIISIEF